MKKKIILGSVLVVFLMLLMPCVSAVNAQASGQIDVLNQYDKFKLKGRFDDVQEELCNIIKNIKEKSSEDKKVGVIFLTLFVIFLLVVRGVTNVILCVLGPILNVALGIMFWIANIITKILFDVSLLDLFASLLAKILDFFFP